MLCRFKLKVHISRHGRRKDKQNKFEWISHFRSIVSDSFRIQFNADLLRFFVLAFDSQALQFISVRDVVFFWHKTYPSIKQQMLSLSHTRTCIYSCFHKHLVRNGRKFYQEDIQHHKRKNTFSCAFVPGRAHFGAHIMFNFCCVHVCSCAMHE